MCILAWARRHALGRILLLSYTPTLICIGLAISVRVYIMDTMTDEEKSLKDTSLQTDRALKDTAVLSHNKTNKLITAIYMVTDIMDKEEPLRNKLRTLGTEIISDMHATPGNAPNKISETLSFLDIASAINLISEMNSTILKKEFLGLKRSIEGTHRSPVALSELFAESEERELLPASPKGQKTRIGVQRGGTLLHALRNVSDKSNEHRDQRKENIKNVLKDKAGGMSIRDIGEALKSKGQAISEKTLQRELVSMVKDNLLYRTGEKRWARYFLTLPARNAKA